MDNKSFERIARLFSQTIFFRLIRPALTKWNDEELTEVQLSCLRFVNRHEIPSISEISEGLAISNAAGTKLVDRLVKKRLLTRKENPNDRRILQIELTGEAKKIVAEIDLIKIENINHIFEKMDQESKESLEKGMISFLKAALTEVTYIDEICLHCGNEHQVDCPGNELYRKLTGHDKKFY